jgi:hypothetical protein
VNDVFSYLNNLEIDKPKTSLKIVESDKL